MPAGRPSLYDPAYCERVIEFASEGMGRAEIAAELGVVRDTLANWEKDHPEFLCAMQRANEVSLAWWNAQGRKGIWAGSDFNANAYRLQVTNRFRAEWSDKQVQEHTGKDGQALIPPTINVHLTPTDASAND